MKISIDQLAVRYDDKRVIDNLSLDIPTGTFVARKTMPNLKVSTVTGGSGQLLRRIEAEVAKPQGDVFWSSSANTLSAFKPLVAGGN
jgi:ABC-type transporter Mla maintaining outer membrane lipid asymmetry ATPase subunit MlaF